MTGDKNNREQQLYEKILKYQAALKELDNMSDEDLRYYYSYNLIQDEIGYLEELIKEQAEVSSEEEKERYDELIDNQGNVITQELKEISKTDSEEIRKEITTEFKKKYKNYNDILVGLNLNDALDGVISIKDEINYLDGEIDHLEKMLTLFDESEKAYKKYINYSDNLELFQGTEAWKKVSKCVDEMNYCSKLVIELENKSVEYDYYYNNAIDCKEEYDNLKFYEKFTKHARELKKEIKQTKNYSDECDKCKKAANKYANKFYKLYHNLDDYKKDFNYYSDKLFNTKIDNVEDYNNILVPFHNNCESLADDYCIKRDELISGLKPLFKNEEKVNREIIIKKLNEVKETRKILKTVDTSERFFNNNSDINKDKIRKVLADSKEVKIPEKNMKQMILKLNLNKK